MNFNEILYIYELFLVATVHFVTHKNCIHIINLVARKFIPFLMQLILNYTYIYSIFQHDR